MVTALWQGVGFPMVLYLAGMQTIPREQYDAAKIDGAGPFECFKSITLPWLRETHVVVVTLAVIGSFNVFDLIYTMTYGGPASGPRCWRRGCTSTRSSTARPATARP